MRQLNNKHFDTIEGASALPGEIVSSQFAPSVSKKDENQMKKQYPYQILLEGRPYSAELEFQMSQDGSDWWEKMTPEQAIQEVEEIRDRYSEGSGWVHYEEILEGSKTAIQERNELRKVVAYMKRRYKKFYLKGGK